MQLKDGSAGNGADRYLEPQNVENPMFEHERKLLADKCKESIILEELISTGLDDSEMFTSNGIPAQKTKDYHDPNFTENVIAAMGPKTSPRMREVMTSLIRHLHDFARETNLTVSEWMAGVELVFLLPFKLSLLSLKEKKLKRRT